MNKNNLIAMLVAMGCLAALSTDIYLPAMPVIANALSTNMDMMQITLALFFATFGLGQLIYGPLSDKFGRRNVLLTGVGLFGAAALLCAQAGSVEMLMLGRLLLGLGACSGAVSCFAICRDVYDKTELTKIIATVSATIGIAPLVAPSIGAMLNEFFGWKSIFYFLSIYAFILFVWILISLPETNGTGLQDGHKTKVTTYRQMLINGSFLPYLLVNAAAFIALFAFIASSPVIFMNQWQFTEYQFSIAFAFNAAWMILANSLLSIALKKYSTETMLKAGYFIIIAAATIMLISGNGAKYIAPLLSAEKSIVSIVLFSVLMGFVTMGIAIVLSTSMSLLLQGVKSQFGKAVALSGFFRFSCGFAIIFAISQMNIMNVTVLATITLICGVFCSFVMILHNRTETILATTPESTIALNDNNNQ
jgi:DHA1 family bicyclomycin/chloramphenicol resistance-like MFS transporter